MTQAIYQWVRNLAVYYIVLEAVIHVMPSQPYGRYIRSFMGVLLILIITSPLLNLLNLDSTMNARFRRELLEEEFLNSRWGQVYGEYADSEYYIEAYEREMESLMGESLEEILGKGCEIREIHVEMELDEESQKLGAASVQIRLSGAENSQLRERVENELAGTYEIPGEKVEILFEKVG